MDDVIMLGLVGLGVSAWNLYLQHKLRLHRIALEGAFMMVNDIAEGKAVIEKTANGFTVRRVENGQVRDL